jgi:hypothetical protein
MWLPVLLMALARCCCNQHSLWISLVALQLPIVVLMCAKEGYLGPLDEAYKMREYDLICIAWLVITYSFNFSTYMATLLIVPPI